jgi:hypothetical protein
MVLSSSIVAVVGMKREYVRTMSRTGQKRPNHVVVFLKKPRKSSGKKHQHDRWGEHLGIKGLLESKLLP